jgi:acetyl-CoA carboxylase biotin carboxyl carrier protein
MTDTETFKALCAEAKDLMKKLEASNLQRVVIESDGSKIEVERAVAVVHAAAPMAAGDGAAVVSGPIPMGAFSGPGISPGARGASGTFAAIGGEVDNRIPVLAPLVGTYYEAGSPGAKAFVEVGQTVGAGDTVCIVEAMKLMNEVAASEGGRVAEIVVQNGERVEFEQVLMYLEPLDD